MKLMMVAMVIVVAAFLAIGLMEPTETTHAEWSAQCTYEHGAGTDAYYICLAEVPGW